MAQLTGRIPGAFRSTAVAIVAYGIAMGFLEAAVVVYLQAALGLAPASLAPVHDPTTFRAFEGVEVARELATLVMIAAVGWLAGRGALERIAWTAVVFGAWDIAYYLGLRLVIGWPLFGAGMTLAGVAAASALRHGSPDGVAGAGANDREARVSTAIHHGTGGRPTVGSPD